MRGLCRHAYRFADADGVKGANAVGVQRDTRARVVEDKDAFDDGHLPADQAQADRRGQPTDASAGNHRTAGHARSLSSDAPATIFYRCRGGGCGRRPTPPPERP